MKTVGPIKKLGTQWWFEFFDTTEIISYDIVLKDIETLMDDFENKYSRFKETSELSRLNNEQIFKNPSAEFLELLRIAFRAYRETQGVFNIAVGGYLEQIGYNKDYTFHSQDPPPKIYHLDDVVHVSTDVIKLDGDVRLDFGGFGKGFLIDKIATFLVSRGVKYFLINGGGDIYVTSDNKKPVMIYLQDPINRDIAVGSMYIKDQGFAASSPYIRSWKSNGREFSHLVVKESVEINGSFVVASSALQADIWATTLAIDKTITPPNHIIFKRV